LIQHEKSEFVPEEKELGSPNSVFFALYEIPRLTKKYIESDMTQQNNKVVASSRAPKKSPLLGKPNPKSKQVVSGYKNPNAGKNNFHGPMYIAQRFNVGAQATPPSKRLLTFMGSPKYKDKVDELKDGYNRVRSLYEQLLDSTRIMTKTFTKGGNEAPCPHGTVPREYAIFAARKTGNFDIAGRILFDCEPRGKVITQVTERSGTGGSLRSVERGRSERDFEANRGGIKKYHKNTNPLFEPFGAIGFEEKYPRNLYNWAKMFDQYNRFNEFWLRFLFVAAPKSLRAEFAEYFGAPDLVTEHQSIIEPTTPKSYVKAWDGNGFPSKLQVLYHYKIKAQTKQKIQKRISEMGKSAFERKHREIQALHRKKVVDERKGFQLF